MAGTRERILRTALELFAEHGFEGTSLQQIADRLGVTKAALYYHFRSKDDLLAGLLTPVLDDLAQLVDGPVADPAGWLETYLDHLLDHRAVISFASRDLAVLGHPAFAVRARGLQDEVIGCLVGRTDGSQDSAEQAHLLAAIALGALHGALCSPAAVDQERLRVVVLDAVRAVLGAPSAATLVR